MAGMSVRDVIDKMIADGASHEQIMEFVQKTKDQSAQANEGRAARLDEAQQQFDDETSPTALAGDVAGTAWGKLKAFGRGAAKLGMMSLSPVTTMHQLADVPEARRELGRGLSDSMFGLPAKLSDMAQRPPLSTPPVGPPYQAPGPYEATEEHDSQQPEVADLRTAGAIAGSAVPGGPMQQLGRGSFALAARLGLSPAMTALAASQIASGTNAALQSGGDTGAMLEAASDPLNLVAPVGLKVAQKAGQAGRAVTSAMRDDTSALGGGADTLKTLDSMRERGAVEGNLVRRVNDPELAALPRGKKGYVKAAQNATTTIGENSAADLKTARAQYGKEIADIEAEHADQAYPVENLKTRLEKLRAENTVNGEPVDDSLNAALDKVDRMTTKKSLSTAQGQRIVTPPGMDLESAAGQLGGRVSENAEATVGDLIKVKKAVGDKAQFGMPATPENRPYRLIWKELAQEAENIDPRIGPLNQKYQQTMGKLEETNDILYGKDAPDVTDRPALRRRAAGKLMRTGDDTTSGELGEEEVNRLAELDPRNAGPIRTLKEKKAIERTRFGMPNMSKSPEKWGVGLLEQNSEATRARVVDPIARTLAAMGLDPVTQALIRARLAAQQQQ